MILIISVIVIASVASCMFLWGETLSPTKKQTEKPSTTKKPLAESIAAPV